jgi:hypothetical protein
MNLNEEIGVTLKKNGIPTRLPAFITGDLVGFYGVTPDVTTDCSSSLNSLEQIGEVTFTNNVKENCNLGYIGGFSTTKFLRSAGHLEDLDFGTESFELSGFFRRNVNTTSTEQLIDIASNDGTGARIVGQIFNGTSIRFWLRDSTGTIEEIAADLPPLNVWGQGTFVKRGQRIEIWMNGVNVASKTTTLQNMTNLASRLSIGVKYDNTFAWTSSDATLIKIKKGANTDIQEEYNDLVQYFNGKVFLVGASFSDPHSKKFKALEDSTSDMGFIAESKNNMQFALNITGV